MHKRRKVLGRRSRGLGRDYRSFPGRCRPSRSTSHGKLLASMVEDSSLIAHFSHNVVPTFQLIVSVSGLVSLLLVWYQIRLVAQWNKFNAHHNLLSYLPNEQLDKSVLDTLASHGCARDSEISKQVAALLYDENSSFVVLQAFLNKYEHFCSAINVGAVDEEHAYSLHSGRVIYVFCVYQEFITVVRQRRETDDPCSELQAVATRWAERKEKQKATLKNNIAKAREDAKKTNRPVFK